MMCPRCGSTINKVLSTRRQGKAMVRRRACVCSNKYTTHETVFVTPPKLLK
jgi:transcriptional regulator NrdR family protein